MLSVLRRTVAVSYTHLDVYKRQAYTYRAMDELIRSRETVEAEAEEVGDKKEEDVYKRQALQIPRRFSMLSSETTRRTRLPTLTGLPKRILSMP